MAPLRWFCYVVLSLCLISPSLAADDRPTPDDYWRQIRKIAASEYSGMDLEVSINTGYQFGGENKGAALGVSVPLYSKKEKLSRRGQVVKFQQAGAELISRLETAMAQAKIYREGAKFLQAKFTEEGVQAVESYFKMLAQIAETESAITQYHREIQSLIRPFTGTVQIVSKGYSDEATLAKREYWAHRKTDDPGEEN